jgi:hypothetical protein
MPLLEAIARHVLKERFGHLRPAVSQRRKHTFDLIMVAPLFAQGDNCFGLDGLVAGAAFRI